MWSGHHGQGPLHRHGTGAEQGLEGAARDVLDHRDVRWVQRPRPVREQQLRAADAGRCQAARRRLEQGEPGRVRERTGRIVRARGEHALPVVLGTVPDVDEDGAAVIQCQAVGAILRPAGQPLHFHQPPALAEDGADHRAHALGIREPAFISHGLLLAAGAVSFGPAAGMYG
jgi:hypothetical protein